MGYKSTALTTGREPAGQPKRPTWPDRRRWYLHRTGISVAELAERERCSEQVIKNSIERYMLYSAQVSNEEIAMRTNSIVLRHLENGSKSLGEALRAKTVTREIIRDQHGNPVKTKVLATDPDHDTRLQAFDRLQKMADRTLPKGGGIAVNVNQQNNAQTNELHVRSGRSFEDLLREKRRARGLSDGTVMDAEVVEPNENEIDESADEDEEGEYVEGEGPNPSQE